VKVKGADLAFVFGTDCLILAWLFVYTRIKGEP
jgi:hypothetical protein